MKTPDRYRFSLQWSAHGEDNIRAGELLERLGNKKSEFILTAVGEYIAVHPEILDPATKVQVTASAGQSRKQLEQMIRTIVDERLANGAGGGAQVHDLRPGGQDGVTDADIAAMVDNLDMFSE